MNSQWSHISSWQIWDTFFRRIKPIKDFNPLFSRMNWGLFFFEVLSHFEIQKHTWLNLLDWEVKYWITNMIWNFNYLYATYAIIKAELMCCYKSNFIHILVSGWWNKSPLQMKAWRALLTYATKVLSDIIDLPISEQKCDVIQQIKGAHQHLKAKNLPGKCQGKSMAVQLQVLGHCTQDSLHCWVHTWQHWSCRYHPSLLWLIIRLWHHNA